MATSSYLDEIDNPYGQYTGTPAAPYYVNGKPGTGTPNASQLPVGTTSVAPDGTLQRWTGSAWEPVGTVTPSPTKFDASKAAPPAATPPGASTTAPGAQPKITNPTDQAQIRAWLQWRASQPGADPYLQSPEGLTYYTNAILAKGGLTDLGFWTNKSTLAAYGGAVGAGGASGAGAAGAGMSVDPSYLKPFTGTFGDAYKELYGKAWDPSQTPGSFQAPDPAQIAKDPGYQFRQQQAVGGLQNTAAARGVLNSGGTLAGILGLEDQMAGQEYDNQWNRSFAGWQGNWTNYNNQFGKAWQQYVEDKDSFYKNESNPFSKLYQAASLGASAASA